MERLHAPWIVRLAPIVFVLLWATGFIGAKYGMRDAEPFTFLAVRFALTFAILLAVVVYFYREEFSKRTQLVHSFVAGALIHGMYLGGVFLAIDRGLPAGLSSLVVSLQPFSTVVFGYFLLGEGISIRKMAFFVAALVGVFFVLVPDLDVTSRLAGAGGANLLACLIGMLSISFGAVYQKRNVRDLNLIVSTCFQFAGGAVLVAILALALETGRIEWTMPVVLSMVWLILVLSIGAVGLLMYLIRQGNSSSVASLFFLVPVVAMAMAWFLFGETLDSVQIAGSAIVIASVAMASRTK